MSSQTTIVVACLAALVALYLKFMPRSSIDSHLIGHAAFFGENFISEPLFQELKQMIKETETFPSNVDQDPSRQSFGEEHPINADGTCSHPFLYPALNRTICMLPQRVDVGKHYIVAGGFEGKKEKKDDMMSRVSSFGVYNFVDDIDKFPQTVKKLFLSEGFQRAAQSVCPQDQQYLDPFQYNFIMQVPGQTVALHLDVPAFWGATRHEIPHWLLVAMEFSNLFKTYFVNQVQVVGYLHEWKKGANDTSTGGEFVYYETPSKLHTVEPIPRAGVIIDGTKVIHAAKVYRPDVKAPVLDKDKQCALKYVGDETWNILCNGQVVQSYPSSDLRISIVYRARCFANEAERDLFHSQSPEDKMKIDDIISTFVEDLVTNKKVLSTERAATISRLDLAMLIMDTYIKYPLPPYDLSIIPINYCAIPIIAPWTSMLFDLIC